jgi:hypothetical protein
MMQMLMSEKFPDIISWYQHPENILLPPAAAAAAASHATADTLQLSKGSRFIIKDTKRFTNEVMATYFPGGRGGATKFGSFARRLRRWKFQKVSRKSISTTTKCDARTMKGDHCVPVNSTEMCIYSHPMFVKGNYQLCSEMLPIPQVRNDTSTSNTTNTMTTAVTQDTTPLGAALILHVHKKNNCSSTHERSNNGGTNNNTQSIGFLSLKGDEGRDGCNSREFFSGTGSQSLKRSNYNSRYDYQEDHTVNSQYDHDIPSIHSISRVLSRPSFPLQPALNLTAPSSQEHYAQHGDYSHANCCPFDPPSRNYHTKGEIQQQRPLQSGLTVPDIALSGVVECVHRRLVTSSSTVYTGVQHDESLDQCWDDRIDDCHLRDHGNNINAQHNSSSLNNREQGIMVSRASIVSIDSTYEDLVGERYDYEPIHIDQFTNEASDSLSLLLTSKKLLKNMLR